MNSYDRVTRAIEFAGPDRVPITHATLPGAIVRHGVALETFLSDYPADAINVGAASLGEFGPEIDVPSPDSWGAMWVRHTDDFKGQVVHHPIADWDALDTFQPPDSANEAWMAEIEAQIAANPGRYILADGDCLFQRMYYLHGFQALLGDLVLEPERCAALRDMIVEVMLRRIRRLCQISGLHGIQFRDDWGTQRALTIRPAMWRSFFAPAYAELIGAVRQGGKHAWFHSDGVIIDIVPDLIAMGVQVLNPQVDVNPREALIALCAGKVCIQGDTDRQWVLPHGTPEDCRAAVRRDLADFASAAGGYIGRAESSSDVSLENLRAAYAEMLAFHP